MKPDYLFVYGTLQTKADNEMSRFLLDNSIESSKGFFYGKLYKISWFPGAVLSITNTHKVYGTIFKLKNAIAVFEVLDTYEGFYKGAVGSSLFIRQQTKIFSQNGDEVNAWVYLYNQKIINEPQIISGDFLKDAKI